MQNEHYIYLREKYPVFSYDGYEVERKNDEIKITFDFCVRDLCDFHPTTTIKTESINIVNSPDCESFDFLVFCLGLVECISYVKATCSEEIEINCGYELDDSDILFFKKLFMNGLGEFFYRNNIEVDGCIFEFIRNGRKKKEAAATDFVKGSCLVTVGGGKDSCVALELVKKGHDDIKFLTINDQKARTDCVCVGGFGEDKIVKVYRTIDKNLLELNRQGFLNGHTPFSAIVAFVSSLVSILCGIEFVVLSNESSANESTVAGLSVNHQYSKSFEFECDFRDFLVKNNIQCVDYFSILRGFSEIQIAKEFCLIGKYLKVFRSCNLGGRKNIWCCDCGKCLFIYCMLSAFLEPNKVRDIFGENLLEKRSLEADFDGLVGFTPVKPFECVGTVGEVRYALALCYENYYKDKKNMPYLLEKFVKNTDTDNILSVDILSDFSEENNISSEFLPAVDEMRAAVGSRKS